MIALIDRDVVVDRGFPREPFAEEPAQLLQGCRLRPGRGFLAWPRLGNVHYRQARHHDDALARRFLDGRLSALDVAPASGLAARRALGLPMRDFEDALVVLTGDFEPKPSEVAVRLGGAGDVAKTHGLWRKTPSRGRVGTGVMQNGFFYGSRTGGFADCIELETGKIVWDERLPVKGGNSAIWTSPVLADGRLYFVNQSGDVFVVRASPRFELGAAQTLGETCNASPAISAGKIFLRTHEALWCFGSEP